MNEGYHMVSVPTRSLVEASHVLSRGDLRYVVSVTIMPALKILQFVACKGLMRCFISDLIL